MTGLHTLFPRSSFVGFDHLFKELEFTAQHANDHYPPHNIIKSSDQNYLIELAIAGFSKDEISVEVKDRTLTVTGEHKSKGREWDVVQLGSDFPKPYTTDAEEEKRLFYVALTRAKKVLNGIQTYKDEMSNDK